MSWLSSILVIVVAVVLGTLMRAQDKRLRRRLRRLETRHEETLRLQRAVYAERARAALESAGTTERMPLSFRSEFGEDMLLYDLFDGATTGRCIEVGAFDGRTYSVTYAFDAMGWDALLVEPVPSLWEKAGANRPHARVVNAALSRSGSSGTATMRHLTGSETRDEASSHLARTDDSATPRPRGAQSTTIEVPLTTMDALLEEHPGPIDLAVIDVEGAELDLLDGFDLERHAVRVILIEDHSMGRDRALIDHLTARAYRHVCWIAYNRLLVRASETDLLDRARALAQAAPDD